MALIEKFGISTRHDAVLLRVPASFPKRLLLCLAAGLLICAACTPTAPTPTTDIRPLIDQGRAHLAVYEWDRAIAALSEAIDAAPDHAEAYCLRGLAYASSPGGRDARAAAVTDYTQCRALAMNSALAAEADSAIQALSAAATAAAS